MDSDGDDSQSFGTDILLPTVLAHELRSPLGAVQGFATLIAQEAFGKVGDPRYVDAAQQMVQACQHMESLVATVLDAAKQQSACDALDERPVDLSELIASAQGWLQQKIVAAKVVLRSPVRLEPFMVQADERRLRQALLNLLENAIRHTPKGGRIDVGIAEKQGAKQGEWIEIAVVNDLPETGGQNAQAAALVSVGGYGLGLYITRCQMRAHGGEMAISPTSDGRAKAALMLPMARKLPATMQEEN